MTPKNTNYTLQSPNLFVPHVFGKLNKFLNSATPYTGSFYLPVPRLKLYCGSFSNDKLYSAQSHQLQLLLCHNHTSFTVIQNRVAGRLTCLASPKHHHYKLKRYKITVLLHSYVVKLKTALQKSSSSLKNFQRHNSAWPFFI